MAAPAPAATGKAPPTREAAAANGQARPVRRLTGHQFSRVSDIGEWAEEARRLGRDLAMELDVTAAGLKKILAAEGEKQGLEPAEARHRAARVCRRLRVAAWCAHAMSKGVVKFWAMFLGEYGDLIDPKRKRGRRFDWRS